jgi:hypothetical protein
MKKNDHQEIELIQFNECKKYILLGIVITFLTYSTAFILYARFAGCQS